MKGKDVIGSMLLYIAMTMAGMWVAVFVHPAVGMALFFVLVIAYWLGRNARKECGRCGPVFVWSDPAKTVERDEEKGTIHLREVYSCPKCWKPIQCEHQTMTIKEYEEIELRRLTAGS